MEAMCTMCTCSGSKILMNGEIDGFYFKDYTLSTSVKPCFLQSDLRFPSALESSAYLKLTSLPLGISQQLLGEISALFGTLKKN